MAEVKLPLNIRKEIRDSEAKKTDLLAKATTAVGSPVSMEFKLEETYAKLATNATAQSQIVANTLSYLEHVVVALEKAYGDVMVKADLEGAWTSHKIAVLAIPDDQWDAVVSDASTTGNRYCRLRIQNGELQSVNPVGYFGSYVSDIDGFDLTPLASAATSSGSQPGSTSLPLPIRKSLRDAEPKLQEALGRIHALKGLEDAKLDGESVAQRCVAAGVKDFDGAHLADYAAKLADLLTKAFKDDMTSEALLEEWKAPHNIVIVPEVDLWKAMGKLVKAGNYNALRLQGGDLELLAGQGYWHTYISDIPSMDVASVL